jgi:hypothetical protein
MKNLQDAGIDDVFLLEKSRRKMTAVERRQLRKSDVMMSFGLTACSAVYYHACSSLAVNIREVDYFVSPRLGV